MKKIVIFLSIINSLLILLILSLLIINYYKLPKQIFDRNIKSVAELKAYTNEYESYGTAIVINNNGELITNYHVISYTHDNINYVHEHILIRLSTQQIYTEVEVIKFDDFNDLAIIKIINIDSYKEFKSIKFGNIKNLSTGDTCYAIGNTNNLSISMSSGIISTSLINLIVDGVKKEYIQSNIDITSGSSGGALVDKYGKLIGITTLRLKDNSGNIIYGYGYSIPINIVNQFIEN